jgi:hypothetical protein
MCPRSAFSRIETTAVNKRRALDRPSAGGQTRPGGHRVFNLGSFSGAAPISLFALVDAPAAKADQPLSAWDLYRNVIIPPSSRNVLAVGRHSVAKKRRKSPVGLAAVIAPAAVFFAAGADVYEVEPRSEADPVVEDVAPCCVEIVAAAPIAPPSAPPGAQLIKSSAPGQVESASRYRIVDVPRLLPVGVASERGLQVRTILAARSISAAFPEILNIGGVRPDALRWHPAGLALDVMIPNPGTAQGIALGNEIVAFVIKNAVRFGMQDAIWRGVYYTPNGPRGNGAGHFDHVHITTTGGGYPIGGETYTAEPPSVLLSR